MSLRKETSPFFFFWIKIREHRPKNKKAAQIKPLFDHFFPFLPTFRAPFSSRYSLELSRLDGERLSEEALVITKEQWLVWKEAHSNNKDSTLRWNKGEKRFRKSYMKKRCFFSSTNCQIDYEIFYFDKVYL